MDVQTSVRDFLRDELRAPGSDTLGSGDSLLDSGLLDSAGIFQLVSFLEERFQFVIADEDVVPEHFETIDAVVAFVETKTGARGGNGIRSG